MTNGESEYFVKRNGNMFKTNLHSNVISSIFLFILIDFYRTLHFSSAPLSLPSPPFNPQQYISYDLSLKQPFLSSDAGVEHTVLFPHDEIPLNIRIK